MLDVIAAPASQANTERIFSVCRDLTSGKRNPLATGLERRVFLKMSTKYFFVSEAPQQYVTVVYRTVYCDSDSDSDRLTVTMY